MDPISDMATTVYRPLVRAATDRMSSTTLPKVAFSRPPMTSPKRVARSSVTSPKTSAKGISATKFCRQEPSLVQAW